jgi:hypothetical protein
MVLELRWVRYQKSSVDAEQPASTTSVDKQSKYIIVKAIAQLCVWSRKNRRSAFSGPQKAPSDRKQRADQVGAQRLLTNADFLESMAALAVDKLTTVGRTHSSPEALLTSPLDLAIASWVVHAYLLRGADARPIAPIQSPNRRNELVYRLLHPASTAPIPSICVGVRDRNGGLFTYHIGGGG